MSSVKIGGIKTLPSTDGERSIVPFNERFIMGEVAWYMVIHLEVMKITELAH